MTQQRRGRGITMRVIGLLLLLALPAAANQYFISFNGKFYFEYPESWEQVPFTTVNFFLSRQSRDGTIPAYEVVLAPRDTIPFHEQEYLFLTVDTVGELTGAAPDSLMSTLREVFGGEILKQPLSDFANPILQTSIVYDESRGIIATLTGDRFGDEVLRRNLLVIKLYERGVANFYVYSPVERFDKVAALFAGMIGSFSTGEPLPEQIAPVRVAEIDLESESAGGSTTIPNWIYIIAAVLLLGIALIAFRRRRGSEQES